MKLPLSPRLLACAAFVAPGDRVADVGCDHGYLSIHLLTRGIARSAIASDVKEQPLQSAVRNAEKYGVRDRIEFFLSNGVRAVPRDFDTMVCAGMGADTMISILEAAPWLKSGQYRLVLQCQSKVPMLRRYLSESGWYIVRESIVRDGRFLYTVMEARWAPEQPRLTPGQWYFSPALLEAPGRDTTAYYQRTLRLLQIAVSGRGEKAEPELRTCLEELERLSCSAEFAWLKKEDEYDHRS